MRIALSVLPWLLLWPVCGLASSQEQPVSFRTDVAPILVARCLSCHTAEKAEGGLDLSTFAALRRGGDIEGEAILEPGDPDASYLVQVLGPDVPVRMPFKAFPLTEAEIETIARWVAEGAAFDGSSETETTLASLVDPLATVQPVPVKVPVSDPVNAVAYSTDGQWLAVARGATILMFPKGTAEPKFALEDHPGSVNAVAFSRDSKVLVAAGGRPGISGFVTIWDLDARTRRVEFPAHADTVLAAALSPDGTIVATASYDRLVKLWNVETGDEVRTLKEHTDAVYGLAFSPDGRTLATVAGDRTLKTWEVVSGRRLASLGDSTAELYTVAFGAGGQTVLAGGADRRIWRWRVEGDSGTLLGSINAHGAPVLRLVVSPDGTRLYSSGEDRVVRIWGLPGVEPVSEFPLQSDWPMALAISPGGEQLAVGRYDGSLDLVAVSGKTETMSVLKPPSPPEPAQPGSGKPPELIREASLGPPSPRGATPGQTLVVNLGGNGVGQAASVVFDDPGMSATILPSEKPQPNSLRIELQLDEDLSPGPRRFWVQTPLGVPAAQTFHIYRASEQAEAEPNERPEQATPAQLPVILAGVLDRPGDVDLWSLEVKAGQTLVLRDQGRAMGSSLDALLEILDASGAVLASGRSPFAFTVTSDTTAYLRIRDLQFGGSGNHLYRIEAGATPFAESVFPRGAQIGEATPLVVTGGNLTQTEIETAPGAEVSAGTVYPVPLIGSEGDPVQDSPRVVAARGPQGVEAEPNDSPGDGAMTLSPPAGASGRIEAAGDVDVYRFEARKGQPLVAEVYASRLGTKLDPVLQILDAQGRPVPRAVLRPVAETTIAFRDHNSSQSGIRLTRWDELAINDYLLVGRELMRIFALPKNPDDDAQFWTASGRRLGYLGTTPEQHPMDQPMTRVEIHPPGTEFPGGGSQPVTLFHRNDDGGPGFEKDAYLLFEPPADGTYFLEVADARGLGGAGHDYHVVVREPRPDFELSLSTENPNIPRGSTRTLTVNVRRIDGFDGPIDVWAEDLPTGVTATPARIEAGHFSATIGLTAAADAPVFSSPTWRLVAEAAGSTGDHSSTIRHVIDPAGPGAGWITVTPEPDLKVHAEPARVEIRPGQEVTMTFRVERSPAFNGRVPVDVTNLPHGVRVLNIGLNGVLITESQTERTVTLYAEPWVQPVERPFFGVGRVEAAGTASSTPAVTLVVLPEPTPVAVSDSGR